MSDSEDYYEVVGGATIPLPGIWGVIISYPLAVLEVDPRGVCVRLTWGRLSAFLRWCMVRMGAPEGSPAEWRANWGAIDRVVVGPRSVVLFRGSGYPCRFAAWKRVPIARIVDDLLAHEVPVERSSTTVEFAYYATQPPLGGTTVQRSRYLRLVRYAPVLVGIGGIMLVTQAGRWTAWTLVGFVIAGLGAVVSMVGFVGMGRRGK